MKEYSFKINGNRYDVAVNSLSGNIADVTVNGVSYQVEMENASAPAQTSAAPAPASAVQAPSAPVQPASPAPAPVSATGQGKPVTSPLPGVIIDIKVKVGDTVKAGQTIAVLEAMKMENDIQAEWDGVITAVNASKGDSVLEGAAIVTIG
ncbi:MAG: biotin/lipoyl-binding protein [Bacteroidales bacterium]|nr:biotin/lipoyl-binding protein [Bacteroidales bacterium]